MPASDSRAVVSPSHHQINFNLQPNLNQIEISKATDTETKKKKLTIENKKKLVYAIVRDIPGISSSGVNRVMEEFCKHQGYVYDIFDYSGYLRYWKADKKIIRVKVDRVWRWMLNHEQ